MDHEINNCLSLYFNDSVFSICFPLWPGGRNIASEGMHKYQILKDCGQPISRETVGIDKRGGSYRFIEEWVYIEENRGNKYMYIIRFDNKGIAGEVEYLGEQR